MITTSKNFFTLVCAVALAGCKHVSADPPTPAVFSKVQQLCTDLAANLAVSAEQFGAVVTATADQRTYREQQLRIPRAGRAAIGGWIDAEISFCIGTRHTTLAERDALQRERNALASPYLAASSSSDINDAAVLHDILQHLAAFVTKVNALPVGDLTPEEGA